MTGESSDSGLDELMRLSQQFKNDEEVASRREEQSAQQREKTHDVIGELREFSISMAAGQLEPVAAQELIEQVTALKNEPGAEKLRVLVNSLASDLEKEISTLATANPDMESTDRLMKTLVILIRLMSSLSV